jgi:hypothetical protein
MSHYIKICELCENVISQCRCISNDKEKLYGICDECKDKMKNTLTINCCEDCSGWTPVDSYGNGTFCDELNEIVYDGKGSMSLTPIPDNCPRLERNKNV